MSEPIKLQATRALVAKLSPARQAHWNAVLDKRVRRQAVGDADLDFANWLDRVYVAVSDEATRVRKEATAATASTVAELGWSVWPLALAALAVGYALAKGRGR
jgi:hypothetical protein